MLERCTGLHKNGNITFKLTSKHRLICIVGNGEDVWWSLLALLTPVGYHHFLVVHWEPLVRVHSDTEQARVGLQPKATSVVNISLLALSDRITIAF